MRAIPPTVLALVLALAPASAEEAPPIAAPTEAVSVSSLPVVRSASQQVDEFSAGLLEGLVASEGIPGLALIVVENDHVMVQKSLGVIDRQRLAPVNGDSVFAVGGLSGAMVGLAAMQQIAQERALLTETVASLLNDDSWSAVTMEQLLLRRVEGADAALARIVERRSGQNIATYIESQIFVPLGMAHSHFEGGVFTTTASDMGRLLIALLADESAATPRILSAEMVTLLTRTHFKPHMALAGWGYVFAEKRRGGWRALQYDGATETTAARLVFEPEARIGYFIVANRNAGPQFWRVVDDSLFDRVLPPRGMGDADLPGMPAPTPDLASDVAGHYLVARGPEMDVLFLRTPLARLRVEGRDDGALVFTGAESATLLPRPGGYWRSDETQLNAAFQDGKLFLDQLAYDRFPLWERPALFGGLAFLLFVASAALMLQPAWLARAGLLPRQMEYAAHALLALSFLVLTGAVIIQRLAFTP
jgi:CubicO group peptidase (beta-lactamase class C family)